ncbi:MAG TPA: hypothetical protein VGK73_31805 [Polyangiaceae bacterium]
MTEPIRPPGQAAPATVELEPITITGSASTGASSVPVPIGDIARQCLSKLDGAVLAIAAAPANPVIAVLGAFKAGLELGECAAETVHRTQEEAFVREAIATCAAEGGTPVGYVPGELICAVPEGAP